MSTTDVVVIKNLTKTFDGREVIKRFDMTVKAGEIYGFLGANGAGKTTVLKLINGLSSKTFGDIKVLDQDISTHRETLLKNIGSVIEVPVFYEHLSAYANLAIHLAYLGISSDRQIKELVEAALERVGLPDTGNQAVSKFSLGMRQRFGIARAIVHKPKLLLLDEPINGLDPLGIREVRELLISLSQNDGVTIIISSHILNEIEHIADKIGVIVDGRIVEEVTLSEIREKFPEGLEDYFFDMMTGKNNKEIQK